MSNISNLTAVIEYRRKDGVAWTAMAAFDTIGPAERYLKRLNRDNDDLPWEYRLIYLSDAHQGRVST